jgi:H+/Cl- antiporter ClcA
VLMGVLAGLLGSLFIRLNISVTRLRARFIPNRKPWLRLLEVLPLAGCQRAPCSAVRKR